MSLKVLIGTYNLNQRLLDQDLTSWLFSLNASSPEKPDIIAIGFQEFNEYPNAFLNINSEFRIKHFEEMIEKAIYGFTKERYSRIVRSIFIGLALVIYIRDEEEINNSDRLNIKVKSVEIEQVGVGPIWVGNKGAIAARLIISTSSSSISVCFVCAHLEPHSHNVVKRNKNFKSIIERVIFVNDVTLYDNDYVFFFGDLNYRIEIDTSLTKNNLMNLLNTHQHQLVISNDQLNVEKGKGQTFNGFQEGDIKFPPTYKYYVGNTKSFNISKRIPGWCDRILYYSKPISDDVEPIILHQYVSNNDYTTSDHKPVSALFTVDYINYASRTSFNYNFKIDKWRFTKKVIGNVFTKVFGSFWWLFGTKNGVFSLSLIISIFIGWYYYYIIESLSFNTT